MNFVCFSFHMNYVYKCLNRVDVDDQEDTLPDVGPAACTLGASTPCTRSTVDLVAAQQSWPAATSRGTWHSHFWNRLHVETEWKTTRLCSLNTRNMKKLTHEYTNSLSTKIGLKELPLYIVSFCQTNELWIFRFWKRSCIVIWGYAFPCRGRGQEWHRSWSLSYHAVHAVFVIQVDEVRSIDLAENSESLGKNSGKMERQDVKMSRCMDCMDCLCFFTMFFSVRFW